MGDISKRRNVVTTGNFSVLNLSKVGGKHEFFKLVAGSNKFDVIPFPVTSKLHPLVAKGKLDIDDMDFCLDVSVHKRIGATEGTYICPKRNYNSPCPICEASADLKASGDEEGAKALWPTRRIFYNVVDTLDRDKGVQIFETNNKYFASPLDEAQKDFDKDPEMQESNPDAYFADTKNGLTVKVLGKEENFEGNKFIQVSSVTLVPRKETVKKFEKDVVSFDSCISVLSYEELEAIFTGAPAEENEPEEEPVRRNISKPKVEEEEVEEEEVEQEPEEEENPCPHGHTFGADNGEKRDCAKCPDKAYVACARASK